METLFSTKNQRNIKETFTIPETKVIERVQDEDQVYANLVAEGGENFYKYLQQTGLSTDTAMIILPSLHHYYYDLEDLKEVSTIVNLKQLNKIKQPKEFLSNIYHILPSSSCFIGNFEDGKNQLGFFPKPTTNGYKTVGIDPIENGIASRIPFLNMVYEMMDAKTNRFLTRRTVAAMLEDVGFKILDMTEIKGLTYFSVQKAKLIKV